MSFCSQWGVGFPACITCYMTRKICIQWGGSASSGGLYPGGSASKGGSASRILWDTVNYWNAFLLNRFFLQQATLHSPKINRTNLYKDLNISDLQANASLTQLVKHWTLKQVIISCIRLSPNGGNFFCCC